MKLHTKIKVNNAVIPFSRWEVLMETVSLMVPDSMSGALPDSIGQIPLLTQLHNRPPEFVLTDERLGLAAFYSYPRRIPDWPDAQIASVQATTASIIGQHARQSPPVSFADTYPTPRGEGRTDVTYFDALYYDRYMVHAFVRLSGSRRLHILFYQGARSASDMLKTWKSISVFMLHSIGEGFRFEEESDQ